MENLRLKYAHERLRLAREGMVESIHYWEANQDDPRATKRLDRSLDLYRAAKNEVRRLEAKEDQR